MPTDDPDLSDAAAAGAGGRSVEAALEAARLSEERLRLALDVAGLGQWDLDLDRRTADRSLGHDRIFGYDALLPEWTYETFLDHVLEEDRPAVDEAFRTAQETGDDWDVECRIRRADGEVRWISVRGRIWRERDGRTGRMLGVVADVTARKERERELEAGRRRFQRAVVEAPFLVLLHAEDGEILRVSRAFSEITGYAPADVPTIADWTERAYGERRDTVRADIDRLYELDRRVDEGVYGVRTADGSERVWQFSSAPLGRDADGRRLVISMAADVTERTRAEGALAESEARYRAALKNSPVVFARIDRDLRYEWVFNPRSEGDAGAVVGRRVGEVETGPGAAELVALKRRALETGEQARAQVALDRDGEVRTYDVTATPVRGARGEVDGLVTASLDVTERTRAQAELRAMSARLVQAGERERRSIARELHDELGGLLTSLQMSLSMNPATERAARDELDEATALVRAMAGKVRQLSLDLRPSLLDDLGVGPALDQLAERFEAQTRIAVELHCEVAPGERFAPEVETTAYRIVQEALTNVARHAGAAAVEVVCIREPGRLGVHVIDEGRGFDVEALDERASTGVSAMRERAALVGGDLEVVSSPGAGTRVSAALPLAPAP